MKAAVYCRLSSEDPDLDSSETSESIINQQKLLTAYARDNQLDIYAVYTDENYSGLNNSRPAFVQMLSDAHSGRFQVILCKNQSRFTRDMETAELYLNNLFPLWGIRFIGICDGADSENIKTRKIRQINGLVNEWYSEDLSENIRMILRDRMREGKFIGSFACYGYTKDPSDRHKLIPDPPAARVVRMIFELYINGCSLRNICMELNHRQIPPPGIYKRQTGLLFHTPFSHADISHACWNPSSVRRILKNPVYTGVLIQGTETRESYKSSVRIQLPASQWFIKENAHIPLISAEAFEQVSNILKKKNRSKDRNIY